MDNELRKNIAKIHTTFLGETRIKKHLKIGNVDVIEYVKKKILNENCIISKKGKNYYCEIDNIVITINSYSYGIIAAHIRN